MYRISNHIIEFRFLICGLMLLVFSKNIALLLANGVFLLDNVAWKAAFVGLDIVKNKYLINIQLYYPHTYSCRYDKCVDFSLH